MICSKCGKNNTDDAVFCVSCNNSILTDMSAPAQTQDIYTPAQNTYTGYSPQTRKKNSMGLFLGLIIGVVILAAVAVFLIANII